MRCEPLSRAGWLIVGLARLLARVLCISLKEDQQLVDKLRIERVDDAGCHVKTIKQDDIQIKLASRYFLSLKFSPPAMFYPVVFRETARLDAELSQLVDELAVSSKTFGSSASVSASASLLVAATFASLIA